MIIPVEEPAMGDMRIWGAVAVAVIVVLLIIAWASGWFGGAEPVVPPATPTQ